MDRGTDRGYLPKRARSLFIPDKPEEKEEAKRDFEQTGLNINNVDSIRYLGAYSGTRGLLEEWVRPKVEAWAHGDHILSEIEKRYPQANIC